MGETRRARGDQPVNTALFMLRWLDRAPEDFLTGPVVDVGDVALPEAGPDCRLRWNLSELHAALDDERMHATSRGPSWPTTSVAHRRGLTNLKTARFADMDLAIRVTQWLGRPAAAFIHPARW